MLQTWDAPIRIAQNVSYKIGYKTPITEISVFGADRVKDFIVASTKQSNAQSLINTRQTENVEKMTNIMVDNKTVHITNNQNVTINVFLNEQCKNAMNLTDWIENIKVTLEDLQYTKDNGFVNGVTNIINKQLQDLGPTERPIHCSDAKRLQFYVKDDDKWSKDSNNEKIDETIYNIKMKQTSKLTDWEKLHPNYAQDAHLLNEWQQILNSMTEDIYHKDKVKDKVRRNFANCVQLKQALTDSTENK